MRASAQEPVMTHISRLVVPTDFSTTSDAALAYAKTVAEQFGASLHLVHAFDDPFTTAAFATEAYAPVPLSLRENLLRDAERRLAERLPLDERTRFNGTVEIVSGIPATAIVNYAGSLGADLIVMGTHGRGGMAHLLLGSVAERVVRTALCPVLTIREARQRTVQQILVPTDFSQTSDAALDYAYLLAERFGASLQLLHVVDDPFITEGLTPEAYIAEAPTVRTALLRNAQARLAHRVVPSHAAALRIDREVLFGNGARTIAEYAAARGVDLIVMGTHGRSGVAHFVIGSVAERLVRTAPCPVLTVRHVAAHQHYSELVYAVDHLPA
jgi:nucleotide-binding universal stress UspA family protein